MENIEIIQKNSSPLSMWWAMVEAQEELAGRAIKDETIVLHFVGSGASTSVTAGQIRKMLDSIYPAK